MKTFCNEGRTSRDLYKASCFKVRLIIFWTESNAHCIYSYCPPATHPQLCSCDKTQFIIHPQGEVLARGAEPTSQPTSQPANMFLSGSARPHIAAQLLSSFCAFPPQPAYLSMVCMDLSPGSTDFHSVNNR